MFHLYSSEHSACSCSSVQSAASHHHQCVLYEEELTYSLTAGSQTIKNSSSTCNKHAIDSKHEFNKSLSWKISRKLEAAAF